MSREATLDRLVQGSAVAHLIALRALAKNRLLTKVATDPRLAEGLQALERDADLGSADGRLAIAIGLARAFEPKRPVAVIEPRTPDGRRLASCLVVDLRGDDAHRLMVGPAMGVADLSAGRSRLETSGCKMAEQWCRPIVRCDNDPSLRRPRDRNVEEPLTLLVVWKCAFVGIEDHNGIELLAL